MLTDEQWAILEPLFQEHRSGPGRPLLHAAREVLNGVLWVLRTGAAWGDLPDRFPSPTTCFRRFSKWVKDGRLRKVLETLARHLEDKVCNPIFPSMLYSPLHMITAMWPKWFLRMIRIIRACICLDWQLLDMKNILAAHQRSSTTSWAVRQAKLLLV